MRRRLPYWFAFALAASVGSSSSTVTANFCGWNALLIDPSDMTLDTGGAQPATADLYAGAERCEVAIGYTWSSSNPSIASISNYDGENTKTINGLRGGTATITVTYDPATSPPSGTLQVTVNPASIAIMPSPVALQVGHSAGVTAELTHTNGDPVTLPVTWSIANTNVATVTTNSQSTATVTAVATGNTTLTATAGTKTAQVAVNVAGVVLDTYVEGHFLNWDESGGLGGMSVAIGPARVTTNSTGYFKANVSPGGTLNAYAYGVCDAEHPLCTQELSYNSTEAEMLQVLQGKTVTFDMHAQRGYHLRITGGAADQAVTSGTQVAVQLDYHVWNRANLPGGNPQIVVGLEGEPVGYHVTVVPGSHDQPTANAMGTTNITFTAPADGTYGVFAYLSTVGAGQDPTQQYRNSWGTQGLFIKVFTLKVCPTAPNCP